MRKIFERITQFFKNLSLKRSKKRMAPNLKINVLDNNISYVNWIESIERQVHQTKIDYALGWIDIDVYEDKMKEYRTKIKDISESYVEYMKRNKISIPKEIKLQYC